MEKCNIKLKVKNLNDVRHSLETTLKINKHFKSLVEDKINTLNAQDYLLLQFLDSNQNEIGLSIKFRKILVERNHFRTLNIMNRQIECYYQLIKDINYIKNKEAHNE